MKRIIPLTVLLANGLLLTANAQRPRPGGGGGAPPPPPPPPAEVNPAAQLMITDLRVIEDRIRTNPREGSRAVWSFRYLIEQMAGDRDPATFALRWLEKWEADQTINGTTSVARPAIRDLVIDPWLAASGGERLDLNKAPFKLLAIVNRMDLRAHDGDDVLTAGEGRFVFGVTHQDGIVFAPAAKHLHYPVGFKLSSHKRIYFIIIGPFNQVCGTIE